MWGGLKEITLVPSSFFSTKILQQAPGKTSSAAVLTARPGGLLQDKTGGFYPLYKKLHTGSKTSHATDHSAHFNSE